MTLIVRTNFHSDRRNNAIQRLKDAGLNVSSPGNTYVQNRISRVESMETFPPELMLVSKSLSSADAPVDYWSDEWPWILIRPGKYIGGLGPDDENFECEFATIEAAVEAVLAFFFGQPTIIDSWMLPLHLHPELSEGEVRAAIASAVTITAEQFKAIEKAHIDAYVAERKRLRLPLDLWFQEARKRAAKELFGKDSLEQLRIVCELERVGTLPARPEISFCSGRDYILRMQFLLLRPVKETTRTLRLRRDLQEGYIVLTS